MFERLNLFSNKEKEISKTISETQKGLFGLEKGVIKKYFSQALDRLRNLFKKKSRRNEHNNHPNTPTQTPPTHETPDHRIDNIEISSASSEISSEMLQELLGMEGSQNFIAKIHNATFGETFVTGPYGMVYKHIDQNGNLLERPIPFKDGEKVSPSRAKENAKAYYNKQAKKWKNTLDQNGCRYTQDMLDALVSASGGTTSSYNHLKNFVTSHRNDKEAIYNFWLKFATTAAGNGKVMPGLVRRRKFEANWFRGIHKPFSSYTVK